MTAIKLTRNEILDLAVKSFGEQLYAEAKRCHDLMRTKQDEIYDLKQQIKQQSVNTSKYDEMIEDLNVTCSRIAKKHGFGPIDFGIQTQPMGEHVRLILQMGGKVSKDCKPKKTPARLEEKLAKLEAEMKQAQSRGIEMQSRMRELEKNQKDARQIILQKLAEDQGVSAQISELMGILVEAEINPSSLPVTV